MESWLIIRVHLTENNTRVFSVEKWPHEKKATAVSSLRLLQCDGLLPPERRDFFYLAKVQHEWSEPGSL